MKTGLREEFCYFGLSFKQVPIQSKSRKQEAIWILNTDYAPERMFHNHPFFYSYSIADQSLGTIYTKNHNEENKLEDKDDNILDAEMADEGEN